MEFLNQCLPRAWPPGKVSSNSSDVSFSGSGSGSGSSTCTR
jgi:hypothetical protein